MNAPQLPSGAKVPITITSRFGPFSTTVTLGECLGRGGSASAYRIAATTSDRKIPTDGSLTHLTDLVLRLEFQLTGRMEERRDAINFLENRRPTDPYLKALVPVYASGDGMATQVAGYQGKMALSVQLLKFAGRDLSEDMPAGGLGWTRVCIGMAGVARTLEQLHRLKWVHRDISPGNLFTGFPHTPTSEFLVGDLGIITKAHQVRTAAVASDGTTTLTQAWSKGPYTPPEVLRAVDDDGFMRVTEYLDVWQLATTMAMLSTGRLPFRGWDPGRGHDLRRQSAYTEGVLSGRYDPYVIKDAPPTLQRLLAKAWAPDPSERPKMLLLNATLQVAQQNSGKPKPRPAPAPKPRPAPAPKPRPAPAPKPRPAPAPKPRPSKGPKIAMGAATLVLVGALVGATNAGQSDPSVENLQRSASTLLGHAQDAITAVMPKQTPTPTPKPTRTIAGHLKVISSGYLQLEYVDEKARFLADYQPQLFAAGPLRGKPMTGTLSLPAWGYCDCFANSQRRVGRGQVKVKIAATSTASKTQTLRLGGTSSILSGAYLVIVTDTKPTYFPPSGLKLRAVSYRIPAAAAIKQAQWVTFVPANPSGYNESARAGSGGSTVPTHWTTMKLAPGKSMADKRVNQSVLVFDLPGLDSPSYWHVSVVWVTDQGVLAGWIDHSHERAVSKF